jgi:hypothetical protein
LPINAFKGLQNLRQITFGKNKLRALHPETFSSFRNLEHLDLTGNICIDKRFNPITSMAAIERELVACGTGYALIELQSLQTQFEEREKKVDRKFELLTELFYNVDERNEENAAEIKEIKKNGRKNLRDVDQQIKKFNVKN